MEGAAGSILPSGGLATAQWRVRRCVVLMAALVVSLAGWGGPVRPESARAAPSVVDARVDVPSGARALSALLGAAFAVESTARGRSSTDLR